MNRSTHFALLTLALVGIASLFGCKKDDAADQAPAPAADADAAPDPLAGLSDDVRAAVLAQRICPVTEEALGSMGAPIAVEVEGRTVYICCEHCRESLEADPAKYFAILDGTAGGAADEAEDAATDDADEDAATDEAGEETAEDADSTATS